VRPYFQIIHHSNFPLSIGKIVVEKITTTFQKRLILYHFSILVVKSYTTPIFCHLPRKFLPNYASENFSRVNRQIRIRDISAFLMCSSQGDAPETSYISIVSVFFAIRFFGAKKLPEIVSAFFTITFSF
jgi:hypothetical protein